MFRIRNFRTPKNQCAYRIAVLMFCSPLLKIEYAPIIQMFNIRMESTFTESLIYENCQQDDFDDEVLSFLIVTEIGDYSTSGSASRLFAETVQERHKHNDEKRFRKATKYVKMQIKRQIESAVAETGSTASVAFKKGLSTTKNPSIPDVGVLQMTWIKLRVWTAIEFIVMIAATMASIFKAKM